MGFLNPIQHRAIVILFCEFLTNLTSLSFNSYFSEPLGDGYGCCRFAVVVFVYACDGFVTLYGVPSYAYTNTTTAKRKHPYLPLKGSLK